MPDHRRCSIGWSAIYFGRESLTKDIVIVRRSNWAWMKHMRMGGHVSHGECFNIWASLGGFAVSVVQWPKG